MSHCHRHERAVLPLLFIFKCTKTILNYFFLKPYSGLFSRTILCAATECEYNHKRFFRVWWRIDCNLITALLLSVKLFGQLRGSWNSERRRLFHNLNLLIFSQHALIEGSIELCEAIICIKQPFPSFLPNCFIILCRPQCKRSIDQSSSGDCPVFCWLLGKLALNLQNYNFLLCF